jgi:hypothetical protein
MSLDFVVFRAPHAHAESPPDTPRGASLWISLSSVKILRTTSIDSKRKKTRLSAQCSNGYWPKKRPNRQATLTWENSPSVLRIFPELKQRYCPIMRAEWFLLSIDAP